MSARFVWNIGAIAEVFPDMPPQDGNTTVLWDRQEKQPVVTIHGKYQQAFCLETTYSAATQPFTTLEKWFNGLRNEALASEGIPMTRRLRLLKR